MTPPGAGPMPDNHAQKTLDAVRKSILKSPEFWERLKTQALIVGGTVEEWTVIQSAVELMLQADQPEGQDGKMREIMEKFVDNMRQVLATATGGAVEAILKEKAAGN